MKKAARFICFVLILGLLSVSAAAAENEIVFTSEGEGRIECAYSKAAEGTEVTFKAVPNDGCRVLRLTASDASGAPVAFSDKGEGEYSFVMPAGSVLFTVVFAAEELPSPTDGTTPPGEPGQTAAGSLPETGGAIAPATPTDVPEEFVNPFTDVKEKDYFYDAVLWAYKNEVTTGVTDTTFVPNGLCPRGQTLTLLWRAAGSPEPTGKNNPFIDVSEKDYFYKAVLWAVERGITKGVTENEFRPYDVCKRGQVVTFLYRAKEGSINALSTGFSDVDMSHYYGNPVAWAIERKITRGITATLFGPEDDCTRGQIVTFIYRAYSK